MLGLPNGNKVVPDVVHYENVLMVERSQEIWTQFGTNVDKFRQEVMLLVHAVEGCVREKDEEGGVVSLSTIRDKKDFMAAFLIIALGHILCPTTMSTNLSSKLMAAASVFEESEEYDWCSFAFGWLMEKANKFSGRFKKEGYVSG